jgi:hypothetical protein
MIEARQVHDRGLTRMTDMQTSDPSLRRDICNRLTRVATPLLCAAAIATTGVTAVVVNAMSSETVIASGFDRAFAALGQPARTTLAKSYDGVSGSEDFWLRTAANRQIVKAMAVGGQITIAGHGHDRLLTITDVRDAGDAETHIDTTGFGARVLLITCREGDAQTGREIQLRLEAGRIVELPAPIVAHAL